MKNFAGILLLVVSLGSAGAAFAGDAAAGKVKSAACTGCHGVNGVSSNPMWPNLAGQQEGYLVKQLQAFRDGVRDDPLMTPMAKTLSDADIDNLAAYYSSLQSGQSFPCSVCRGSGAVPHAVIQKQHCAEQQQRSCLVRRGQGCRHMQ
jgi:cytochrome c553